MTDAGQTIRCLTCGYDLRGLPRDGRCPECGRAVSDSWKKWPTGFNSEEICKLVPCLGFGVLQTPLLILGVALTFRATQNFPFSTGSVAVVTGFFLLMASSVSRLLYSVPLDNVASRWSGGLIGLNLRAEWGYAAGVALFALTVGLLALSVMFPTIRVAFPFELLFVPAAIALAVAALRRTSEAEVVSEFANVIERNYGARVRGRLPVASESSGPLLAAVEGTGLILLSLAGVAWLFGMDGTCCVVIAIPILLISALLATLAWISRIAVFTMMLRLKRDLPDLE